MHLGYMHGGYMDDGCMYDMKVRTEVVATHAWVT